jgi:uncharacterized protein (DUF433 family)
VVVDPKVMLGKPVIKGTRITVERILRKLGEGASEQELLDAYPQTIRCLRRRLRDFDSLYRFKGQEAPAVISADVDPDSDKPERCGRRIYETAA